MHRRHTPSISIMADHDDEEGSIGDLSSIGAESTTSASLQQQQQPTGTISKGRKKRMGQNPKSMQSKSSNGGVAAQDALRSDSTSPTNNNNDDDGNVDSGHGNGTRGRDRKQGILARAGQSLRSLSRSRASRAGGAAGGSSSSASISGDNGHYGEWKNSAHGSGSGHDDGSDGGEGAEIIITVTSCRSDAYHDQRAPGATSKLPRRAPNALKTFHELAVGIKDAYEAGGCMPKKPTTLAGGVPGVIGGDSADEQGGGGGVHSEISDAEREGQRILYDFMGNLDFLLALVDEVAIDTATRGALKEDTTFRGLRDVIKKCNKVLESLLVRRERKYTLMFRIVGPLDSKNLKKISHWNLRVETALGGVTQEEGGDSSTAASSATNTTGEGSSKFSMRRNVSDDASDAGSEVSSMSTSSARSSVSAVLRRGREMLPTAGKVRARRATPTPRLRRRRDDGGSVSSIDTAGEDGYSSETVPMTTDNLAKLQLSLDTGSSVGSQPGVPPAIDQLKNDKKKKDYSLTGMVAGQVKPMKPKDELLDVIRGLRTEQMRAREAVGSTESNVNVLDEIKSNFTPKAEIPPAVPKLPIEYIHRHRLMKQVVNCLLDRAGPRDTDDDSPFANTITCITSRHSDKAGNGKTTLAVAAIQTVEVREFFSDGIAWIHLGRTPLGEREIRRLYEQLYDQLLGGDDDDGENDDGGKDDDDSSNSSSGSNGYKEADDFQKGPPGRGKSNVSSAASENKLAKSRRSFQGGELEGMKEDLARLLLARRVLICLDDVCRMEDAKWFLFGTRSDGDNSFEDTPHRVLITTRIPGLVGPSITHEVFVRIFSEHEAVKLLLTAAGRRPNGLPKTSPVFAQARIIVKGCGNSPLALRIAGGMLRSRNRNWTLSSPAWKLLVEQCRTSLEEASKIRSFANSVQRLIDLSFATVLDLKFRSCLRQCFVAFAMVFHDTDSLKVGKGISRSVVIRLFAIVSSIEDGLPQPPLTPEDVADQMEDAALILDSLETMNLVQRAGHGVSKSSAMSMMKDTGGLDTSNNSSNHRCYSMHESVRMILICQIRPLVIVHLSHELCLSSPIILQIKAIAEEMAKRKTEAFAPVYDEFNSFVPKTEAVPESAVPPFLFDEYMVMMLTGEIANMAESVQESLYDRLNIEEYITENMPLHLIRAKMAKKAAGFLIDQDFCKRRVIALGPIEATRRHVSDLIDLRRAHATKNAPKSSELDFDIVEVIQGGSACIIDEVLRQSDDSPKSISTAICLSTMGEGLIKARQPREASQRLDEAATLYRELLGKVHVDVARAVNSVAKSLVKINETRAALVQFGEASSAYEECNSSHHFDSIANLQGMANLFVTSGDFQAATALYENVINRKQSVHGESSVATAKTINDYAVILAKNGRMDDALARYEMARATYEKALNGLPPSMSWLNHGESAAKCGFDMALINLNIASIKSKKGDTNGAINSYEKGVQGLRKYKDDLDMAGDEAGKNKNSSHMRHLVSALGRIGSLKLKLGDKNGALEAYAALFLEVDNESPMASRLEKAKAHIKCATIYRQSGEREDNKHAILHLREALNMYTDLYGSKHKDTVAVATSLQQWMDEEKDNCLS